MAQMGRPGLSSQQKQELWSRWKAGQSLSDIGRSLGKHAGSIFGVLHSRGGIAPTARRRSRRSLSVREREEISRGLVSGLSLRRIAAQLGRAPSTISREVERNNGRRKYRAANADERAWRSACRPKPCRLAVNRSLQMVVAEKLNDNWSPQQISGWLKVEYINDEPMRVSHERRSTKIVRPGTRSLAKSANLAATHSAVDAQRQNVDYPRTAARPNR